LEGLGHLEECQQVHEITTGVLKLTRQHLSDLAWSDAITVSIEAIDMESVILQGEGLMDQLALLQQVRSHLEAAKLDGTNSDLGIIPMAAGPVLECDTYGTVVAANEPALDLFGDACVGQLLDELKGSKVAPESLRSLGGKVDEVGKLKQTQSIGNVNMLDGSSLPTAFITAAADDKVIVDLTGKLIMGLDRDGQIVEANGRAADLLVNATRISRTGVDNLAGLDILDAVRGHGLEEFLSPDSMLPWRHALIDVMKAKAPKLGAAPFSKTVDLEMRLGNQRAINVTVDIVRSGGPDKPYSIRVVAEPHKRLIWEEVDGGPIWVEPAVWAEKGTWTTGLTGGKTVSNAKAKALFNTEEAVNTEFELWRGLSGIYDKEKRKMPDKVVTEAGYIQGWVLDARQNGQASEEVGFSVCMPDGNVHELVADISPLWKVPFDERTENQGVLIDASGIIVLGFDLDNKLQEYNMLANITLRDVSDDRPITGCTLEEFATEGHLILLQDATQRALQGEWVKVSRVQLQSPDTEWGRVTTKVRAEIHPWLDETGYIIGYIVEALDMAQHVFQCDTFDALMRGESLSAAWLLDTDGFISQCNPAAEMAVEKVASLDELSGLSFVDLLPSKERANMKNALLKALQGEAMAVETSITQGGEVARLDDDNLVDIVPCLDDSGHVVGVYVMQQNPCAITCDSEGCIVECNQAAADLVNMPTSEILGQEVMDLFGGDCQNEVFETLLTAMEANTEAPQTMAALDVQMVINSDNEFTLADARLAVEARQVPGSDSHGVLMLFQPKAAVATKKTRKKKDGELPSGSRQKGLHGHGGWKALRDGDFHMENVDLHHRMSDGPQDPMHKMLYELCAVTDNQQSESFTLLQLRRWLLKTPIEERPQAIAQLNPWHQGKMKRCFDGMDNDGDGYVQAEEFFAWWNANVETTIVTTNQGIDVIKEEAQRSDLEVNIEMLPASPESPPATPGPGVQVQLMTVPGSVSSNEGTPDAGATFQSIVDMASRE